MNRHFPAPDALAIVKGGNSAPNLYGEIKFYQKKNFVIVTANINGLPRSALGFFGFHIHEGMGCSGDGFSESGSHFNPTAVPHPSHAGDLPPLMLCGGGAHMAVATDRFRVTDIIGRTVIIHDSPDDFNTQPSGNAGTKIACGVIKRR